ncbi:MAG TPA: hypothetical protein P5526_17755 [Anaerolineae bacterium]|nr:hypothetical protein [Anaerolineae bacterium]
MTAQSFVPTQLTIRPTWSITCPEAFDYTINGSIICPDVFDHPTDLLDHMSRHV